MDSTKPVMRPSGAVLHPADTLANLACAFLPAAQGQSTCPRCAMPLHCAPHEPISSDQWAEMVTDRILDLQKRKMQDTTRISVLEHAVGFDRVASIQSSASFSRPATPPSSDPLGVQAVASAWSLPGIKPEPICTCLSQLGSSSISPFRER